MLETPLKLLLLLREEWSRYVDNHAGNLRWLAGFIDADGCITLGKQIRPGRVSHVVWTPLINICTTCTKTADHISRLLTDSGFAFHRQFYKVTKPNWTDRWHINIRGFKRVARILPVLYPDLVTKQEEAQIVLDFIAYRQSLPHQTKYGERELEFVARSKAIKRSRHK